MSNEIIVNSWEAFDTQARKLVSDGMSNITPRDQPNIFKYPLAPMLGYEFFDPKGERESIWVKIEMIDFKSTRTELIMKAFQSEQGKINVAKAWGNYVPRVKSENTVELTWEQQQKIMDEAKSNYEKRS